MRKLPVIGAASALALAALIAACDDPESKVPTNPSLPALSTISVNGAATVAPGQSDQFTATILFADGTSKAVTSAPNLRWQSSNTSIFQVSASGLVTATQQRGEATVTATWTTPARTSSKEVVVVPDGTFRLAGQVTEADGVFLVAGARVEAVPGGIVTTTNATGQFKLFGVPADATIRVTAEGYIPSEKTLHLTEHGTHNVQLALSAPRAPLGGAYTLTLDLLGACPGQRPLTSDLQHRSYQAVVAQSGSQVDVLLTEPRYRLNARGEGNRFTGRATASGVDFFLGAYYSYYGYYYYPNVVEQLPNGTFFVPSGSVRATGSASTTLSGQMNAFLANWNSSFPTGQLLGSCSGLTQFTLTRR